MNETELNEKHQDEAAEERSVGYKAMTMWTLVLLIYVFLLASIGYIAFWDQDFNKAENTVGSYVGILSGYQQEEAQGGNLSTEDTALIIQEMMKKGADSAGDLQELASQSFNIVLGAILAFLSASATMVFQQINSIRRTGKSDEKE